MKPEPWSSVWSKAMYCILLCLVVQDLPALGLEILIGMEGVGYGLQLIAVTSRDVADSQQD